MKYPQIIRDTIDFTSDTTVCNTGYLEITLNDSRPCRIEGWYREGIDNVTIFISKNDLEDKEEKDIKKYLEDNNIIKIIEDKIYITELEDAEDNSFLSINVPLSDHDNVINELKVTLKEYDY